jgi:hypothetical protein
VPKLTWNAASERFYEAGVDRGVLYIASQSGVAWSGLVSVTDAPSGGVSQPYYLDAIKILNLSTSEDFGFSIQAFTYPPEFASCDGSATIQNGLFITQQERQPFNFSYRSLIGNGLDRIDHGYRIHFVYNALAAPVQKIRQTRGVITDPSLFNWTVSTKPASITGHKPTSRLEIDSRFTDPAVLATIEDILYGTEAVAAAMPTPDELIAIFNE